MGNGEIWPPAKQKPLNRSSPNLIHVITSWVPPYNQTKFGLDPSRVFFSPYTRNIHLNVRVFTILFCFLGFFQSPTPARTFTLNTSNDVIPCKEVPFGGCKDVCIFAQLYLHELRNVTRWFSPQLIFAVFGRRCIALTSFYKLYSFLNIIYLNDSKDKVSSAFENVGLCRYFLSRRLVTPDEYLHKCSNQAAVRTQADRCYSTVINVSQRLIHSGIIQMNLCDFHR